MCRAPVHALIALQAAVEDKAGGAIFEALERLADWLAQRKDIFPSSFGANYAAHVLTRQVRGEIAKVCLQLAVLLPSFACPCWLWKSLVYRSRKLGSQCVKVVVPRALQRCVACSTSQRAQRRCNCAA